MIIKQLLIIMKQNSTLSIEILGRNSLANKKRFMGLYASTDGKIDGKDTSRYVKGTMDDFKFLLTKNKNKLSETELNKEFTLLYNNKSKQSLNEFVVRYVENTDIRGPVIIIKSDKSDVEETTHKWIGKQVLKKCNWLGFSIDL